jgi:hypothetical protein
MIWKKCKSNSDKISDTVEDVQAPLLKRFSQIKTPINKTPEQGEFIEYQIVINLTNALSLGAYKFFIALSMVFVLSICCVSQL